MSSAEHMSQWWQQYRSLGSKHPKVRTEAGILGYLFPMLGVPVWYLIRPVAAPWFL